MIAIPVVLIGGLMGALLWPRSGPPAVITVADDQVLVTMRGPFRLFALRSKVEVPVASVVAVRTDDHARGLVRGFRTGTATHNILAGTFKSSGCRAFWAVDDGHDAVVIDIAGETFDRVVVEVADPEAVAQAIRAARGESAPALTTECED